MVPFGGVRRAHHSLVRSAIGGAKVPRAEAAVAPAPALITARHPIDRVCADI